MADVYLYDAVRTPRGKARPDGGLAGSGVIIVNPPWRLDEELAVILPELAGRLSQGAPSFEIAARD